MDNANNRTIGAVILTGLGLLLAAIYLKKQKIGRRLQPGAPIPVLLRRGKHKELATPVPPGRARIRGTARWILVNQDDVGKHVRIANVKRDGTYDENPFERLPEAHVPGHRSEPMEVAVKAGATRGRYTYDIYVDGRLAKDPEIMIET